MFHSLFSFGRTGRALDAALPPVETVRPDAVETALPGPVEMISNYYPIILLAIVVIIALIVVLAAWNRRRKKKPDGTDRPDE